MGSLTERMSRFAASRTLTRHTSGLLRPSPPGPNSPSTTAPTTSKKMSSAVQTPPYATDSSFFFFFCNRTRVNYVHSTKALTLQAINKQADTNSRGPSGRAQGTPDPTVLTSKLDQYPDEAWGWDSVLIRDPHQGEDPNQ